MSQNMTQAKMWIKSLSNINFMEMTKNDIITVKLNFLCFYLNV